jgi:predicted Zn-dependent protease
MRGAGLLLAAAAALAGAALAPGQAAAAAPTARQMAQYRTLQANVDQAFLWAYLNKNHENIRPATGKTRYLGTKIVNATGNTFFFNCHFYTVKSDVANAITSPKGNIFLYGGLDRLKLSEAEKAAVIAHEIGHLARSHWLARIQRNVQAQVLANYTTKSYGRGSEQISQLSLKLRNLQYSREEEYEADALGAQFLLNAGYPPSAMETVLIKLDGDQRARADGQRVVNPFLSDHPMTPDRIRRLEALIPTLRVQRRQLRPLN